MSGRADVSQAPRLGFLGVGWIGRSRLESVIAHGSANVVVIADASRPAAESAAALAGGAKVGTSLNDVLGADVEGVVIATPSALHAEQAVAALSKGLAVFCQKPVGRDAAETRRVVDAARESDRLLGVDLSYRYLTAVRRLRHVIRTGELGHVFAVEATFHNAYAPDKAWARDSRLAGGGCLIDLGIHLVDLSLWLLGFPPVTHVSGRLLSKGIPRRPETADLEDYATATLATDAGTTITVTCSWNLPIGENAMIRVALYGTRGGAAVENVDGSFYDFRASRFSGATRQTLADPPDAWGGRALDSWVQQMAISPRFDPRAEEFVEIAAVLDRVYDA